MFGVEEKRFWLSWALSARASDLSLLRQQRHLVEQSGEGPVFAKPIPSSLCLHGFSMDLKIVEADGSGQWSSTPCRESLHLFPALIWFSPDVRVEEDQDQPLGTGWLRALRPETRLWEPRIGQLARHGVVCLTLAILPTPVCHFLLELTSSLASSTTAFQKEEESSPCPSPDPSHTPPSVTAACKIIFHLLLLVPPKMYRTPIQSKANSWLLGLTSNDYLKLLFLKEAQR